MKSALRSALDHWRNPVNLIADVAGILCLLLGLTLALWVPVIL